MIIPTHQDANLLLRLREEPLTVSFLNQVAGGLCEARGEQPILVRWAITIRYAIFHPIQWMIVLPRLDVLDFLHEIGHMLSILDRGRSGTEEEAETFAHGVCSWLWPERYGMDGNISWYLALASPIRQIVWTADHLNNLIKD